MNACAGRYRLPAAFAPDGSISSADFDYFGIDEGSHLSGSSATFGGYFTSGVIPLRRLPGRPVSRPGLRAYSAAMAGMSASSSMAVSFEPASPPAPMGSVSSAFPSKLSLSSSPEPGT